MPILVSLSVSTRRPISLSSNAVWFNNFSLNTSRLQLSPQQRIRILHFFGILIDTLLFQGLPFRLVLRSDREKRLNQRKIHFTVSTLLVSVNELIIS